jgi:hypothetical protein
MRRRLLAAAAVIAALAVALPAGADFAQQRRVQINPVDNTPRVLDGEVRAFAQMGGVTVVGGDFTSVSNAAGTVKVRRTNIFAFDVRTGTILSWAPQLDAPVLALAPGDGNSVYVGGAFQRVNGVAERALARISLTNGAQYPGFTATANWGDVRSLINKNGYLYAAGSFSAINGVTRVGLARLNAASGAVDSTFDLKLAAPKLTRVKLEDMAITSDGGRLAVVGAVQQVAGQVRAQMFLVDTNVTPARLDGWYTDAYTRPCRVGFETYLRGVDFDPTNTYAVVVATGRMSGNGLMCDSAARFELAGTGLHKPTWVNYTGGDSLYSVSATGSAIYVGGHQRWMDNPQGHESKGPGAVDRSGIAAIDPISGKATDWNPGRKPRGVGARALLATPYGLLVGSDTENLGGERHERLGLLPL